MMWELHVTCITDLRYHDYGADLLHLVIVWRGRTIEIAGYLDAEIGDRDEALEDILGHDVCVVSFFVDVVRGNVDIVGTGAEVGGGNGSSTPLRFRSEGLLLKL